MSASEFAPMIERLLELMRFKLNLPRNRAKKPPEARSFPELVDLLRGETDELVDAIKAWRACPSAEHFAAVELELADVANYVVLTLAKARRIRDLELARAGKARAA